jgi:hypothetical protein
VICFEFLQLPENVLAGDVRCSDYRSHAAPDAIRIEHHKTGANVLHPLVDPKEGSPLYPDAEAVLASVPKRGIPLVLKGAAGRDIRALYCDADGEDRAQGRCAGLSKTFTLNACRHGGMTELEEAGLIDGQGRALSAHRSKAYEGYAKRTLKRALGATRRQRAHVLAAADGRASE